MTTTKESRGWETRGDNPGWKTGRRWLRGWELAVVVNRRKTTGEMSEQ